MFILVFLTCVGSLFAQDFDDSVKKESDELSVFLRNAQYQNAIAYIDRQEPTKDLLYQKALCYKYLNDYSAAITILESLAENHPADVSILLQLALSYESTQHFRKSIACYDKLVEIDSVNTYFRVRKADLLYRLEDYQAALSVYLKIEPDYNPNYVIRSIAMCHDKLDQSERARNCYAEAWSINPHDAYSAVSLVKIFVKLKDYPFALRYSEDFMKMDSTNLQINVLNAFCYYNMSMNDEATKRLEKCREQGDSSLIVNRTLGNIYYIEKKDSLAVKYLNHAYLQDTTNMNVLYCLANSNYNLQLFPEAIDCYMKIVDRLDGSEALRFLADKGLGMSYEGNGKYLNAMSFYLRAVNITPYPEHKAEMYYRLGNLCEQNNKDYNFAISYYKKYRVSLVNYQSSLKEEDEKIAEIEQKLEALDEHLLWLAAEQEKNPNKKPDEKAILNSY
jgi:tetratricopeptide (TPR) repeat protein